MRRAEIGFLGAVVAVLLLGLVLDTTLPSRAEDPDSAEPGRFESSGWYCPVPPGEDVEATIVSGNLGDSALGLRRSAIGGSNQSAVDEASLGGRYSSNKSMRDFGMSEATGLVEAFGANNSTSLIVMARNRGVASSRCSAQPSDRWLFAGGSTSRNDNHYLLISNPFQEEAVVQVRLMARDKEVIPARLKDLVIRAFSQSTVYLSDYVQEEPNFGIEVTASRGRIVASRYSSVNTGDAKGISVDIGTPVPSSSWLFAGGRVPNNGEESLLVVNPGTREALIGVVFMTGEERTAPPELAEVPVPAGRQVVIDVSNHLPRGTIFGAELTSTNGVPVVAERRTMGVVDRNRSYESVAGVPAPAARWVVPAGSPSGGSSLLAMANTGQEDITVSVVLLSDAGESAPPDLSSLSIGAGRKVEVDLDPYLDGKLATAIVTADRPVLVVESQLVVVGTYVDYSSNPGQPMR